MSLYSYSFYLPPLEPPKVDPEFLDQGRFGDDRIKIAEAEAALENEHPTKKAHPIGGPMSILPFSVEEFFVQPNAHANTAGDPSPMSHLRSAAESMLLDLSSTAGLEGSEISGAVGRHNRAGNRLPPRVTVGRSVDSSRIGPVTNTVSVLSSSLLNSNTSTVLCQDLANPAPPSLPTALRVTSSEITMVIDTPDVSPIDIVNVTTVDTESSDNIFLADEEEAEAAITGQEEDNNESGSVAAANGDCDRNADHAALDM